MERTRTIEHAGRQVLLLDYTGLKNEADTVAEIEASMRYIDALPADGSLLLLTDGTGGYYSRGVLDALKRLTKHNAPYAKASAGVSSSITHRTVVSVLNMVSKRKIQFFPTRQEALDWLVKQ